MFRTVEYFWLKYWKTLKRGKPKQRALNLFIKILFIEIKYLLITGHSMDEII